MSVIPRVPTVCGGFVDIPLGTMHRQPTKVRVSFSKFEEVATAETRDHIVMTTNLLARRPDHMIYSCGGLFVKIYDTRGLPNEEVIVRIVEEET